MRRWRLTAASVVLAGALALLGALIATHGSRARARATPASPASGTSGRRAQSHPAPGALGSAESSEVRRLISMGRPVYCGAPRGNEVALTFDDGPGTYTRLVI